MPTYTITADQLASIKASRLQHLDNGDEAAAKALGWVLTAEPNQSVPDALPALLELARQFPTDSDLYECGWTQKEVDAACNAHERACEVIRQSKKEA